MKDKEILYQSLVDIKKLITSKELSPVELTQMSLERIDETNDKTNAFLNVYPEMALADAKKVEEKIIKGEPLGLMAGIPTSIKDLEPVKDMITTKGSLLSKDEISDIDQIGVERIKEHDGIILGNFIEGGYIHPIKDIKINDRFFINGDRLRGFKNLGVGPRDSSTTDALGGEIYYLNRNELTFPLGLPDDLGVGGLIFAASKNAGQ